jgi:hypothetical protein
VQQDSAWSASAAVSNINASDAIDADSTAIDAVDYADIDFVMAILPLPESEIGPIQWHLDSTCTVHLIPNQRVFESYNALPD